MTLEDELVEYLNYILQIPEEETFNILRTYNDYAQKLKWSNCFSYGSDNELHLDDNTVTQIIGTNGMGKSSIPLIIEEILYNKNSKGIKKADIPNRYINDGYSIFLSFEKDGSDYEISVDRKSSIKVKLEKDGEDISSHTATNTYKTIQEILGIDFKTFHSLYIKIQMLVYSF